MKEHLDEIIGILETFVQERNWKEKHRPKSMATSVAIEAAELLEIFQWDTESESNEKLHSSKTVTALEDELADVAIYLIELTQILYRDSKALFDESEYATISIPSAKDYTIRIMAEAGKILQSFCEENIKQVPWQRAYTNIMFLLTELSKKAHIDLTNAIKEKMRRNNLRFPVIS